MLWYNFIFQYFDSKCLVSFDLSKWQKPIVLFGKKLTIYLFDDLLPNVIPQINLLLKFENAT